MDQTNLDIPAIVADKVSRPWDGNPFGYKLSEKYSICKSFHNSLPVRVRVIDRMGVSTIILPCGIKGVKGEFYIQESRNILRDVKFDSSYLLNSTATLYDERKLLAEEKEKDYDAFQNNKSAAVTYTFTMRRLMAHGGIIYHPETDTVIAVVDDSGRGLGESANIVHPFSHEGRIESSKSSFTKDLEARRYNDFAFTIRIVDNLGSYGKRFTLINNQVYSIAPVRDTQAREGIYVSRSFPVEGDYESKGMDDQYYPLGDDADNFLGLYRSFHQALVTKERLASLELELKEMTHQHRILEAKAAETKTRMQQEIDELTAIRNKRKEMNALNNEMYKTNAEFLKHLPLIISALGTIIIVSLKVAESVGGGGEGGKGKK